ALRPGSGSRRDAKRRRRAPGYRAGAVDAPRAGSRRVPAAPSECGVAGGNNYELRITNYELRITNCLRPRIPQRPEASVLSCGAHNGCTYRRYRLENRARMTLALCLES